MQFDPNNFIHQETTEEAKRRPPIPVGDYLAQIGDLSTKAGDKDGRAWVSLVVPLAVQLPPNIQHELGYNSSTFTLTDRPFLDFTEAGTLDWSPGRNRRLMDYRIATGQNVAGEAFSLSRLTGRVVKVKISHEMYEGNPQERIGGIAAA